MILKKILSSFLALTAATFCLAAEPVNETGTVVTDSWYTWAGRGATGYFHLVCAKTGDQAVPMRVTYEFVINADGTELSLNEDIACKDDAWFTPLSITCSGKGDDEFKTYTATIDWLKDDNGMIGTLRATIGDRKEIMTLPEGTVDCFAVFEIVRRLPGDKDKPFAFHSLESMELNLKRDYKIAYAGEEEIGIGDKRVLAKKFEEGNGDSISAQYWVGENNHELLRVIMDGEKEFLLATEAEAKAALNR